MTARQSRYQYKPVNVVDNGASVAAGAVILTYTPTTGKGGIVTGASAFSASGTAEVDIVLVSNSESADITVARWNAGEMDGQTGFIDLDLALEPGDVIELEVTTTHAANTADVAIYALEEV